MSIFLNRNGNISLFRVGVTVAIVGLLLVIGGFSFFTVEQAARRRPFVVPVPAEVEFVGEEELAENAVRTTYFSTLSPEDVAAFYDQRLNEHYRNDPADPNRERCIRDPQEGQFPDFQPGAGNLPYQYTCLFDNSNFQVEQFTQVRIHPGIRDDASGVNYEGVTRIDLDQVWQP